MSNSKYSKSAGNLTCRQSAHDPLCLLRQALLPVCARAARVVENLRSRRSDVHRCPSFVASPSRQAARADGPIASRGIATGRIRRSSGVPASEDPPGCEPIRQRKSPGRTRMNWMRCVQRAFEPGQLCSRKIAEPSIPPRLPYRLATRKCLHPFWKNATKAHSIILPRPKTIGRAASINSAIDTSLGAPFAFLYSVRLLSPSPRSACSLLPPPFLPCRPWIFFSPCPTCLHLTPAPALAVCSFYIGTHTLAPPLPTTWLPVAPARCRSCLAAPSRRPFTSCAVAFSWTETPQATCKPLPLFA